jgi:uncharacterized integral membrane protein (TIGR00698 family)
MTTTSIRQLLSGLFLSLLLGLSALGLSQSGKLEAHGLGPLTLAIMLGMLVGNTLYGRIAKNCAHGVDFSRQKLLRLGIIFYGFHLTLQDIGQVGAAGVLIDALVLCSTFAMAWLLGTRLFKLDRNTSLLIGVGSSICGAAAIMAAEPVVRGRAEQVTVAVATVLVFGTLATVLYPWLFEINQHLAWIPTTDKAFGIYTGSTVHEVAQVVAAAHSVSPEAADTAVIAKMVRVMMLAPFLIVLSAYLGRNERQAKGALHIAIPWFAVWFFGVMLMHSFVELPTRLIHVLTGLDTLILATAMASLGLSTHVSAIRRAGYKPLLLAAILFAWLVVGGAMVSHIVMYGLA